MTGMVALGDLPGGTFNSRALGASADGSVIVGAGWSDAGPEAFRWTVATGMVGLGDLSGGEFYSAAMGVSADGSVAVGRSNSSAGDEAFVWDESNGMRSMKDVLESDFGLDLTGREIYAVDGLDDDLQPGQSVTVRARRDDGTSVVFEAVVRIDSPVEVEYYRNGGVLHTVLRDMVGSGQ